MPTWLLGSLLIGGTVLLAHGGLWLVRRQVDPETLRASHDVAGFLLAIVGVIYAVLLALVVVSVWEEYKDAETATAREANGLADVFRMSYGLPGKLQIQIRVEARAYAHAVVTEEWPLLARGKPGPQAVNDMDRLWAAYERWEPKTSRENVLYSESISALRDMNDARRVRLLESRRGVPGLMWFVLCMGGIGTVVFTYFFGAQNFRAQALMTGVLAAEIALVLLLIMALDYPFSGDLRVQPTAFTGVSDRMDEIQRNERQAAAGVPRRKVASGQRSFRVS